MANGWEDVKQRGGCPICGRKDWCGFTYGDYNYKRGDKEFTIANTLMLHCQGVDPHILRWGDNLDTSEGKFSFFGIGKKEGGALFVLGDLKNNDQEQSTVQYKAPKKKKRPVNKRFSDSKLNEMYRFILSHLTLEEQDRKILNRDGITDKMIEENLIRSYSYKKRNSIAAALHRKFGDLTGLPGAHLVTHKKEKVDGKWVATKPLKKPYWTLAGPEGILFNMQNFFKEVVCLRVRRREVKPGMAKYVYVSSDGGNWVDGEYVPYYNNGSSPGARVGFHVPPGIGNHQICYNGDPTICYVIEGEKKSIIAVNKLSYPALDIPGAGSWAEIITPNDEGVALCDLLRDMGVRIFLIAYDNDKYENEKVMQQQNNVIRAIKERGFMVGLCEWDGHMGKGIDDMLNAGYKPMYFLA